MYFCFTLRWGEKDALTKMAGNPQYLSEISDKLNSALTLLAVLAGKCSTEDFGYISQACNPELFDTKKCKLAREGIRSEQYRTKRYEQLRFEKANVLYLVERVLLVVGISSSMVLRTPVPGNIVLNTTLKHIIHTFVIYR